ncbi:unnamed protein product [Calypogeia fissa]
MSWFSRSFSMAEEDDDDERRRRQEDEDDDEEEEDSLNLTEIASATGASIKEDLSNLRKTFTRQLWGVASFIAPPPPEKSSTTAKGGVEREEEKSQKEQLEVLQQEHQQQQGQDEEVRYSSGAAASEIASYVGQVGGFIPQNFGLVQSNTSAGGETMSGGAFLTPEESDPQLIASPHNNDNNVIASGEKNLLLGSNRGFERPKLTGLRSDFAELRGTVATGISRITSVLLEVAGDDDSGEDDEEQERLPLGVSHDSPHHPLSSPVAGEQQQGVNSPRRSIDAFLKPLFGNLLMRERSSSIEGDMYPAEDEAAERGSDYSKESPKGKGETKYRELESLPSALASGIGEISKFASSLLQIVTDELDEDKDGLEDEDLAVGLTEPVVTFARNIAMHPETWLDFPLTEDDADDDFELTNAQKAHVLALEVVAPGLEALKIELCPNYITEGRFWKIYFVLMHSRLSSNEALMLSNQQVVRARELMLQEMQRREPPSDELDHGQEDVLNDMVESDSVEASQQDIEQTEDGFGSRLLAISNSGVSSAVEDTTDLVQSERDKGRFSMLHLADETETDEWPDEEPSSKQHDIGDPDSRLDTSNLGDEDVSFSDLEEDDSSDKATFVNDGMSLSSPKSPGSVVLDSAPAIQLVAKETSSPTTQGDGTPRKSSERGEFNDWFKVDQDDVASAGSSSP